MSTRTTPTLNVGILGYAGVARAHLNALKKLPYIFWSTPMRFRLVGIAGRSTALAPKTIHNIYITLSAFFTWACREFEIANPRSENVGPPVPQGAASPAHCGHYRFSLERWPKGGWL